MFIAEMERRNIPTSALIRFVDGSSRKARASTFAGPLNAKRHCTPPLATAVNAQHSSFSTRARKSILSTVMGALRSTTLLAILALGMLALLAVFPCASSF
jgi:hypothetical protein